MFDAEFQPRRPTFRQTLGEFVAFTQRQRLTAASLAEIVAQVPRGDGTSVLVIPSLFRGDEQTTNLRKLLDRLGYRAHGWGLGANLGPTNTLMGGAMMRLADLTAQHGPIAVVGFSMGGMFARWLAFHSAPRVRQVISVGSPIRQPLRSAFLPTSVWEAAWRGQNLEALATEVERPLSVPSASLYSRRDGIVAWESCCPWQTNEARLEVACHHVMMPQNPEVFRLIAETLARNGDGSATSAH
jgi:hypothetical protein